MAKSIDAARILARRRAAQSAATRERVSRAKRNLQIAKNLRFFRNQAGLRQEDLAEKIGTSQPAIARLEAAACMDYSVSMLDRIAQALEIETRQLLEPLSKEPIPRRW